MGLRSGFILGETIVKDFTLINNISIRDWIASPERKNHYKALLSTVIAMISA
jgi:hypothetical protein